MTKEQLKALIDLRYPDNVLGLIFPVHEREVLKEIVNFSNSSFYNIKDLGAKGDGVTDDTAIINSVLVDLAAELNGNERGATIYFPSGVYILDQIILSSRLKILGDGKGVTILKLKNGSNKSVIFKPKSAWLNAIEGITVDGNKANNTAGHGIEFEANSDADGNDLNAYFDKTITRNQSYTFTRIQDVVCANCPEDGLYITSRNYLIDLSHFVAFGNNGHGIQNFSTDNFFSHVVSERNGKSGIYERGANNKWNVLKLIWNGAIDPTDQAGLRVLGSRISVENAETQDNWCDGFRIEGKQGNYNNVIADGNGYANPGNFSGLGSARLYVGFRLVDAVDNVINGSATNYRQTHPTNSNRTQERGYVVEGNSYGNDLKIKTVEQNQKNLFLEEKSRSDDFYVLRPSAVTVNLVDYAIDEPILLESGLSITEADTLYTRKSVGVRDSLSVMAEFTYNSNTGNQARLIRLIAIDGSTALTIAYVSNGTPPYLFFQLADGTARTMDITLVAGVRYKLIYAVYNRPESNTREYFSIARLSDIDVLAGVYPTSNVQPSVIPIKDVVLSLSNENYGEGRFDIFLHKLHLSTRVFDKTNHLYDFIETIESDLFIDFEDLRKKQSFLFPGSASLPTPQQAYRNMQVQVRNDIEGDRTMECIRRPDGTYLWADVFFNRTTIDASQQKTVDTSGVSIQNIVLGNYENTIIFTGTGAAISGVQGWDRKELILINQSSGDITIAHLGVGSADANRFFNTGEVSFVLGSGLITKYFYSDSKWRKIE